MEPIYHLLLRIGEDPTSYLGKKASLELLCAFLLGYERRADEAGLPIGSSCMDGFQLYVANYYGLRTTTRGWPAIIQFFSDSMEEAFSNFYDLLEKHIQNPSPLPSPYFIDSENPHGVVTYAWEPAEEDSDKTLYGHLMQIKKRPGMYLGANSLKRLYAYLSGYRQYEKDFSLTQPSCLDGFSEYVRSRYQAGEKCSWAEAIRFSSTSDADALDRFYQEWERFRDITMNRTI